MRNINDEVSRKDELLDKFMAEEINPREKEELSAILKLVIRDKQAPKEDRLMASIVSRIMDAFG